MAAAAAHRVLVIDSYADTAESLALALCGHGIAANYATSATDALTAATAANPTAVLLDLDVRGSRIEQICQDLRVVAPEAQLIAVSGWSDPAHFKLATQCGFDHYLIKPASVESIKQALVDTPADGPDTIW
jgi:ActR/RegA family two-component response regulator